MIVVVARSRQRLGRLDVQELRVRQRLLARAVVELPHGPPPVAEGHVALDLVTIRELIAPLLQQGVELTLPEAANTEDKPENDGQTTLAVTADGRFFVEMQESTEVNLLNDIQAALDQKVPEGVGPRSSCCLPFLGLLPCRLP